MNPSVMILLSVSILGILLFLVIHIYSNRKKTTVTQRLLVQQITTNSNLDLIQKEIINNQFIALDRSGKLVLLSHLDNNKEEIETIPLSEVSYCRLDKQVHEVVHRGRNRTASEFLLNKISLLLFSASKRILYELVFFDQDKNSFKELPYLSKRAEYWKKLITRKVVAPVA
jgi:hypothetical protein